MTAAANLFGVEVGELDVHAFLSVARNAFAFAAVAFIAAFFRRGRPAWLVLAVLAANLFVWAVTNYPLQRLYALGVGRDRVANVAYCQVAAAGNSPVDTWQVGQTHFDATGRPHHVLWASLVAALSGWEPERVLAAYGYLPLAMAWATALALFAFLRVADPAGEWTAWERALVAGSATLLASAPLDFTGPYDGAWEMTFLLKPNHALGLAVFPAVLWAVASARGWRGRVLAAALLHLLAWVFILHFVYVAWGLVVFALLSWLSARADRRRDLLDAGVAIGVNVLVAVPVILPLVIGRLGDVPHGYAMLPPESAHLFEVTTRGGGVFVVGAWGAIVAYRRGDRIGRILASQVLAALVVWLAYLLLSAQGLGEQPDEINYWLRFLVAASAGVGAWDLAGRAARLWPDALTEPRRRVAAILLVALPWTLPYWWNPARMDRYFAGSRPPLPESLASAGRFLRERTPETAVLAGDQSFARWAAALSGRRSLLSTAAMLPRDIDRRRETMDVLFRGDPEEVRRAAAPYSVTHLVVTPTVLRGYGLTFGEVDARGDLQRVFTTGDPDGDFLAIFELFGPAVP